MKIPNGFNGSVDLECPRCGGNYMHQGNVEVFMRKEDAETGNHALVEADRVTVDRVMAGNPSSRRQGVTIEFQCEDCEEPLGLAIVQHKGQTFLYWI